MKDKKKQLIVATISVIAIIVIVVGVFLNREKPFDENTVTKVIGDKAKVESYTENDSQITINLVANVNNEDAKNISKDILSINKSLDKDLVISFIKNENEVKDDFYYENLLNRATYYKGSGEIAFESFVKKDIKVAEVMDEFTNNKILSNKENNLVLSLDVSANELKDEDIVAQAKAYTNMFKQINNDKTLESVQVNINFKNTGINVNDKYTNVYSRVEYIK